MDVPCGNRLLDALSDPEALDIVRTARIVTVRRGDTTTVHGRVMSHVDFPLTVLMSVKGILANGTVGEVASVGSEGFVEVDAALESDLALRSAECQFGGDVARMSLRDFRRALELSRPFALLVRRAVRARIFVTEQTAICNLKHDIVQRLARWLLVARDRLERQRFDVTHEYLATILGVRRAGVTTAVAELEQRGAIAAQRGNVVIHDAARLAEAACECYALCADAIDESLGQPAANSSAR
jgi:Crp-like helix-turn-helix domain